MTRVAGQSPATGFILLFVTALLVAALLVAALKENCCMSTISIILVCRRMKMIINMLG